MLKKRNELSSEIDLVGFKQSGLYGAIKELNRKSAILTDVKLGKVDIDPFVVKSGGKGLLGTDILRHYVVL